MRYGDTKACEGRAFGNVRLLSLCRNFHGTHLSYEARRGCHRDSEHGSLLGFFVCNRLNRVPLSQDCEEARPLGFCFKLKDPTTQFREGSWHTQDDAGNGGGSYRSPLDDR